MYNNGYGPFSPYPTGLSNMMAGVFLGLFWLVILLGLAGYILTALAYWKMGKKAGIEWAWVAWIPGGSGFVIAKMARWQNWQLWPILLLAGILVSWIPVVNIAYIGVAVLVMIQAGQVMESFHYSYAWMLLSFVPVIGTVIYLVVLLRIAFLPNVRYHEPPPRNAFGSPLVYAD